MIARIWRGVTSAAQAEAYFAYLMEMGLKGYCAVAENRGVQILRRASEWMAECLLISLWESYEAIRVFAGEDRKRAVSFSKDQAFPLELEPKVTHDEEESHEE